MRANAAYMEGVALVGGQAAYEIAKTMRRAIEATHRVNGGGIVPLHIAEAVDALERAGRVWFVVEQARQAEAAEAAEVPATSPLVRSKSQGAIVAALGTGQVGRMLGCSSRWVRELADSGQLPAHRGRSNRWEFDPIHVQEFLRERAHG
jgi:hypothetical protein